ncbi:aminodeoxychorismate/anthranilate synthase component II [bacterium]|nr:aminodeoxychorismate/anthranilate synthase component II [bacterium]
MILLIDNYDSFTYNLAQYLSELGEEPLVRRNDEIGVDEIAEMSPAGIVISPGPCTPNEAGISVEVVKRLGEKIPILGVCLGHQSIGQAFGGKVIRAPEIMHGKVTEIYHRGDGIFAGIDSPFKATRYHSLIVEKETLPACLVETAWTEGAHRLIMGLRHREHPVFGVQFHPESILTTSGKAILKNFLGMLAN